MENISWFIRLEENGFVKAAFRKEDLSVVRKWGRRVISLPIVICAFYFFVIYSKHQSMSPPTVADEPPTSKVADNHVKAP